MSADPFTERLLEVMKQPILDADRPTSIIGYIIPFPRVPWWAVDVYLGSPMPELGDVASSNAHVESIAYNVVAT